MSIFRKITLGILLMAGASLTCAVPASGAPKAIKAKAIKAKAIKGGRLHKEIDPRTHVKYIFYFIGDGMGMGQVMAAQAYNRHVLGNQAPITMMQFPAGTPATNFSASSPVTDSAAAGTALSSGRKTNNGMIGMTPDSVAIPSIARIFHDNGYGIGIVTSVYPDDATPGAFYAHVPDRGMYYEIGKQAADCGYDFIGGSNLRGLKKKDGSPTDLMELFAEKGVSVVRGVREFDTVTSKRVLMLSPDPNYISNIGYTIDSIPGALTLKQMTQACLRQLERNGHDKFFMMVEAGNIDHACHGNDGGAALKEVLNFQQSIELALNFYREHPRETLIVVTADHETGGLGLGNNVVGYDLKLGYYDYQKISKDKFAEWCRSLARSDKPFSWDDMKAALGDKLGFWRGVPITEKQTERLHALFDKCITRKAGEDHKTLYASFNEFTDAVYKTLDEHTGLGWTTNGHTGGLIPVFAEGVGSALFNGMNDNTDLPKKILQAAGISAPLR